MKFISTLLALILCGCSCSDQKTLKVAASAIPHAEMLEFIKPDLAARGIKLKIVEIDDYQLPNRLLMEGEVDANFFQHLPFLETVCKQYGDRFEVLAYIHYEPLGIYSEKLNSLQDLNNGGVVSIPSDPSNESRALLLLERQGLITLKRGKRKNLTLLDIESNPKGLKFNEIDAPLIARLIADADISLIPANFALQAHVVPNHPPLALEDNDLYPNVVVVRKGELEREDLQDLKRVLTSDKMRQFLSDKYKRAVRALF